MPPVEEQKSKKKKKQTKAQKAAKAQQAETQYFTDPNLNMMANFLKANNNDSKLTDQILTLLGQFQTSTSSANHSPPQLMRQQ